MNKSTGTIKEVIKSQSQCVKVVEGAIRGGRWQGNAHIAKVIVDMFRNNSSP